jgi:[acyl-carrier-protein] S-malonyltransferase
MGATWFRASVEARTLYEQADAQLGYPLSRLCFQGPEEELNRTEFTQPAVFVTSLAMWQAARGELPSPDVVAGHSLGEFAALVVAGALEFSAGLRLVAQRGRLMAQAGDRASGGMAVLLGATLQDAEALCAEAMDVSGAPLVVANDNCPGQVVISGATEALSVAMDRAQAHDVRRIRRLAVSVAPHSPLMAAVQADFAQLLTSIPLSAPSVPIVLNATAAPLSHPEDVRRALLRQLTSPVRWRESLLWMAEHGVETLVEVGPKRVLSGLVRRTLPEAQTESVDAMQPAQG